MTKSGYSIDKMATSGERPGPMFGDDMNVSASRALERDQANGVCAFCLGIDLDELRPRTLPLVTANERTEAFSTENA